VGGATVDLGNQGLVVVVEFDLYWTPLYHLLEGFLARPTLPMLIVAPRVHLPILHKSQCMCRSTLNRLHCEYLLRDGRSFGDQTLDQDG
jgi:hypothetical protein